MRRRSGLSALAAVALLGAAMIVPPGVSADVVGVTITLPAGHHVTGLITDQDSGDPVAGVTVYACADAGSCAPFDPQAVTGVNGEFDISGVAPGDYAIVARGPLQDVFQWRPAFWDGVTGSPDDAQATPVTVSTSDIGGITMALVRGTSVQGTLTLPGGGPAVGVHVIAEGTQIWPSEAVTTDTGHFNLIGLPPGQLKLRLEPDLEITPTLVPGYLAAGHTVTPDANLAAAVTSGQSGANATMVAGRFITGTLSGVNAWGIDVMAAPLGVGSTEIADVDNTGSFSVGPLWDDQYIVTFSPHPAFDDEYQGQIGAYAGEAAELVFSEAGIVPVTVSGSDPAPIHPIRTSRPTVSGVITGDYGAFVADTLVVLTPKAGGQGYRTRTGGDGAYAIANVPPAVYTMEAQAPGYALKAMPDVTVASANITGRNAVLSRGYAINGKVVGPGGVPVEHAVLHTSYYGGFGLLNPGFSESGVGGVFRITGLLADQYTVSASPPPNANLLPATSCVIQVLKDKVAPVIGAPKGVLVVGSTIRSTIPVSIRWSASDPSGIARFQAERRSGTGAYSTAATVTSPSVTYGFAPSTSVTRQVRVRGQDGSGNWSAWVQGSSFRVLNTQSSGITAKGSWSTGSTTSASGGSYRYASASGASLTYTFTGRSVGLVGAAGPAFGMAKVYIDGLYIGTIDQYAAAASWRKVQYVKTWSTAGTHTIKIVCMATVGHPRTNLDAIAVVR